MFGHNDQQQHHDTTLPAPASDGGLVNDDQDTVGAPPVEDVAGGLLDDAAASSQPSAVTTPTGGDDGASLTADAPAAVPAGNPDTDRLLDIKQQALQQLTPLVGHLEQNPEEKFRTTMMMIQAADNHALIQTAYEAAQQITDEKVRAQALLDIVNEINYFTHNNSSES